MSDFFKRLNGEFGTWYRQENKGRGYVFQDRYKSTLIQDESYLLMVIAYVLKNPVRAGLVNDFLTYEWSSAAGYYNDTNNYKFVDIGFVEKLFGSKRIYLEFVGGMDEKRLPLVQTREGHIIGGKEFYIGSIAKYNRRKTLTESLESKRIEDKLNFDPAEKTIQEFEDKEKVSIDQLDTQTFSGKRLRAELLVYLRDRSGKKYREISEMPLFSDVKFNSLGSMYTNAKNRMKNKR